MKLLIFFVLMCGVSQAQDSLMSESILKRLTRISAPLPANINEAHAQRDMLKAQYDSLEQMFTKAYPALADKMKRRSARLNSMAGVSVEGETLSLIPYNQKMADFFRNQWTRMDELEKTINQTVKTFYGKEAYKTQGYIPAWDSVYRLRKPALVRYREAVIKLVQADIEYMKANKKMFSSNHEAERMQYVEQELSILQKLNLLKERLKRILIEDGTEKVEFCKANPQACKTL